ncbi:MAG: prephenate dehydratase [Candidatus Sumerlaeota bacterium]|nr:prephenate dehydratase [Candidatus Sumerlaeota bacterium]
MDEFRKQIDEIDTQVIQLLDRRAEIAQKIGEWKRQTGRPVFDGVRQRVVLDSLAQRSRGIFPLEGLRNVFTEIMSACLNLEESTRVAYLGPEATFTHQAAADEFGGSGLFISCDTIPDIFESVEKGRAHYGVVPIENSTGGVVYQTLDRFIESPLRICAERSASIELHLLANCSLHEIKVVYSHPNPFVQCRDWLQINLPIVPCQEVKSTVLAAELAAKEPHAAAIAGEMAAKKLKLRVLERGIQDSSENVTRFWIIGRDTAHATGNDKTSILFFIKDRPGALYEILRHMADASINMTKIESRPSRRAKWQYAFFVDFIGHHEDENVRQALGRMEELCEHLRILGSYPRDQHA